MLELLVTASIVGYIIYLRYYADLRSEAEKEREQLTVGIKLYDANQYEDALAFFEQAVRQHLQWSVAYLYRARCHLKLGNAAAAFADLKTAESYDDTVADVHLDLGQFYYERSDYAAAFAEFDKAVFHAQGRDALAFYWRGLTRQKLGNTAEGQADLDRALALEHQPDVVPSATLPGRFFDRRLLTNAGFVLFNSGVLLHVIKHTPVVHWPYALAVASAGAIGFAEPRKGWALAILQATTVWLGYTFFTDAPTNGQQRALETFCLYGSLGLTFVGSFIGGMLKRAMLPRVKAS